MSIEKLRETPFEITSSEFEQKVLLDYVNISSYDLLVEHKLAESVLEKIIGLQPDASALQDLTLLDCDLSDNNVVDRIKRIYSTLYSVPGLWVMVYQKLLTC